MLNTDDGVKYNFCVGCGFPVLSDNLKEKCTNCDEFLSSSVLIVGDSDYFYLPSKLRITLLTLGTCGLYVLYFFYKTSKNLKKIDQRRDIPLIDALLSPLSVFFINYRIKKIYSLKYAINKQFFLPSLYYFTLWRLSILNNDYSIYLAFCLIIPILYIQTNVTRLVESSNYEQKVLPAKAYMWFLACTVVFLIFVGLYLS